MHNSNENKIGLLTRLSRKTKAVAPAMVLAVIAAWSVLSASAEKPKSKIARNSTLLASIPYADPAYDQSGNLANGSPPLVGSTLVYEDNAGGCDHHYPINAPDGSPITLTEWQEVKGEAHARCAEGGTQVDLRITGLIPHGLYTIWLATFVAPGLTPDYSTFTGVGALGQPDGSQNWFKASADGKAELSVFHPGGPLSVFGEVKNCFMEETEIVLWLALHLDGQTHGPAPHAADNPCTVAFPGGFSFKQ